MSLIKPTKVLNNKKDILEMADLLIDLKSDLLNKHPNVNVDTLQWALEQSIMRVSLRDGHEYN